MEYRLAPGKSIVGASPAVNSAATNVTLADQIRNMNATQAGDRSLEDRSRSRKTAHAAFVSGRICGRTTARAA
jgi:hypothetical protein